MLMLPTILTLLSALRPQTIALLPLNPSLPLSTGTLLLLLLVHKPETWPSLLTPAFPSPPGLITTGLWSNLPRLCSSTLLGVMTTVKEACPVGKKNSPRLGLLHPPVSARNLIKSKISFRYI